MDASRSGDRDGSNNEVESENQYALPTAGPLPVAGGSGGSVCAGSSSSSSTWWRSSSSTTDATGPRFRIQELGSSASIPE